MDVRQVGEGRSEQNPEGIPQDTPKEKTLDLSVPQVAGSAVAAVVAAKLASNLGVYGTILGAGVVSALGTCGGSVFQHVFRRTGRHVHEVAVQAKPRIRLVPMNPGRHSTAGGARAIVAVETDSGTGTDGGRGTDGAAASDSAAAADSTRLLGTRGQDVTDVVTDLAADRSEHPDASHQGSTSVFPAASGGAYSEGTVHRVRVRGWKRPVIALALAFGLTMGGITAYEALSGNNISGSGNGTTVGDVFSGGHSSGSRHTPPSGHPTGGSTTPSDGAGTGGGRQSSRPSEQPGGGTASPHDGRTTPTPSPSPTNSGSGGATNPGSGGTGPSTGPGGQPTQSPAPGATPAPHASTAPSAGSDGLTGGAGSR